MWAMNRPAGLTTVFDTQFDPEDWHEDPEGLGSGGFQWFGDVNMQTATAGHSFGNTHSARCDQPGNSTGDGVGSSTIYRNPLPFVARQKYDCVEMRIAATNPSLIYSVHTNKEKWNYDNPDAGPGGGTALELSLVGSQVHNGPEVGFAMLTQDGSDPPWLTQPDNGVFVVKEQWQMIEVYKKYNTPGSSNGILRIWIDNILAWELTNVSYSVSGSQRGWADAVFDDTRGGGSSAFPTPTGGQYREFARWLVAASNSLS